MRAGNLADLEKRLDAVAPPPERLNQQQTAVDVRKQSAPDRDAAPPG